MIAQRETVAVKATIQFPNGEVYELDLSAQTLTEGMETLVDTVKYLYPQG